MDEKKELVEPNMKQLEHNIIESLNEMSPKIDYMIEATHENKGSTHVEQISNNKNLQEDLTPIVDLSTRSQIDGDRVHC